MLILRDYQIDAVTAVTQALARPGVHPLIQAPTGAGKSLILAELVRTLHQRGNRLLMLTHVKELVEQNEQALLRYWPDAPVGVCCAGLNRFELDTPIVFGSVQTCASAKRLPHLGPFRMVGVDEAHLVPPKRDTRYRLLEAVLRERNLLTRWFGLSATPWRLDNGHLTEGKDRLFTETVYQIGIRELIRRGHLVPPTTKGADSEMDTDSLHVRAGEFVKSEVEDEAMKVLSDNVAEIVRLGRDRKRWLLFCSSVKHAQAATRELREHGIDADFVVGETPRDRRDELIERHKDGKLRALVNVDVLTTGFDSPGTDLVAMLRATCSSSLYLQMVGRGMRTAPAKDSVLVLDFGGNAERHGCITDPAIEKGGPGNRKELKGKKCPQCREVVPIGTPKCACGYEWEGRKTKLRKTASRRSVLGEQPWRDVGRVFVSEIDAKDGGTQVMVDYRGPRGDRLGLQYLRPEGGQGWQRAVWHKFWQTNGGRYPNPDTVAKALERWGELQAPEKVLITTKGSLVKQCRWSEDRHDRWAATALQEAAGGG